MFGSSPLCLTLVSLLYVSQPFRRFLEVGRVAMINYGEEFGKLVVIVDIVDQNRVLIDAPKMRRGMFPVKRLVSQAQSHFCTVSFHSSLLCGLPHGCIVVSQVLTDITLTIGKVPSKKDLLEQWNGASVETTFAESSWGKKIAKRKAKEMLNDFDRFKVMMNRVKKSAAIRKATGKS